MKVLFIVDSYNWALYNRAVSLSKYLYDHAFDIKSFQDLDGIDFNSYDIVYSLNWPIHGYIKNKLLPRGKRKYRLVTTICSHINRPSAMKLKPILNQYDAISCANLLLHKEFQKHYKHVFYTPFGVESELFSPRTSPSDYQNVVGWVGNKTRLVKRFPEIKAAVESIPGMVFKYVDESSGYNREQMAEYYNSIGTLVCFSTSEGTPNPVLEAASCGRFIISSNVGNVPKLRAESKAVIKVGTEAQLRKAIANISRYDIDTFGARNRKAIENSWSWSGQYLNFVKFIGLEHKRMSDIDKIVNFWNVGDKDRAFHDRIAGNKNEASWGRENIERLIGGEIEAYTGDLKGKQILEFGCGAGRILKFMSEKSDYCHGTDIAPHMLRFAREHIRNSNVILTATNGKQLPYGSGEFDLVYSIHVLQHIPTKSMLQDTLKEFQRVLRRDGGLAILHFNGKISELDREPGQFAGYRPTLENAIKMTRHVGLKLENKVVKKNGDFYLHLSKD
jgi:ubiquinone/menaquinone biosynthesis C-methylase UbiE